MLLLNHFSEKFDPASCKGTCDNCASTDKVEEIDLSTYATHFVKMIEETKNRRLKITGALSLHAFRGTSKAEMAKRNFNTLPHSGKGSNITTDLAKRLFDHLIDREILATELEEQQNKDRAPISYVYVIALRLSSAAIAMTDQGPCSSGPRPRSFLRIVHPSF